MKGGIVLISTSWSDNPRAAYLSYYLKKYWQIFLIGAMALVGFMSVLRRAWTFAALLAAALTVSNLLIPKFIRVAFDSRNTGIYTRPDAPGLQIAYRTSSVAEGGMTPEQRSMMSNALDLLPAAHLAAVKFIGVSVNDHMPLVYDMGVKAAGEADEAGTVVLDSREVSDPGFFQQCLLHEIGHLVEFHTLAFQDVLLWRSLHDASSDLGDFVSSYAQTNEKEDFAETYAAWTTGSADLEFSAVDAVTRGNTVLVQKFLYMAALFTQGDGTVKYYGHADSATTMAFTPLQVTALPYYRTASGLTVGAYTYRIQGNVITSIEDLEGNAIADHLSIPIPSNLLRAWKMTGPPPPSPKGGTVERPCNRKDGCPAGSLGTLAPETPALPPLAISPVQVELPGDPSHYVPLLTKDGYRALAREQAMLKDQQKILTVKDQIRPHDNFSGSTPAILHP